MVKGVSEDDIHQLTVVDADSWAAFTLLSAGRHLIVYNSSQSAPRINSVVMHELAHILLGHQLHDVMKNNAGEMVPSGFSKEQEEEANWLGGTLLLPRPALLNVRSKNWNDREISDRYLVSSDMLHWRLRMTGVDRQIGHRRAKAS
ncbi:ImmA/IrrE family metallo-endopeptidase [Notoacmeibacter marinus]|uniref:ImmA/IrrE family metallo-endopeptidase n=1 Tax=Notoacmeibacter marinus TaxID=1876515 RepID=UPI000DF3232E|nr:ImmA/IrrE family metallo-endopeptidase [Notoacmeibacter marinus]